MFKNKPKNIRTHFQPLNIRGKRIYFADVDENGPAINETARTPLERLRLIFESLTEN